MAMLVEFWCGNKQMEKFLFKLFFVIFLYFVCTSSYAYKTSLYDCQDKFPTEKNCEKICGDRKGTVTIEVDTRREIVMSSIETIDKKTPLMEFKNCRVVRDKVWSCRYETISKLTNRSFWRTENIDSFDGTFYFSSFRETSYVNEKSKTNVKNYCGLLENFLSK